MRYTFRIVFAIIILAFAGCTEPDYGTTPNTTIASLGTPESNEIWFTTSDGSVLRHIDTSAFDVPVADIIYSEYDMNIIRFEGDVTTIGDNAFNGCHNLFNLSLPNSVTTIGEKAFYDCKNMECLTLGSGLRNCGYMAFDYCINLHSLHIPSVKSWCNITFASQTANPCYYSQRFTIEGERIRDFIIPNGVKSISPHAFVGNSYLTSITVPTSVERIGANAFVECDGLERVIVESLERWSNIEFENEQANPLWIARNIFHNGVLVTDLSLKTTTAIKSRAFINCTSIKSLTIEESVETIGLEAFRGCISLKTVVLGTNTAKIDAKAFMGCRGLAEIKCFATYPPLLGDENVFESNAKNRTIAVPYQSLEHYRTDEMWSKYKDSIIALPQE